MTASDNHWRVSVVIPVYNAERYISRAIESVLCQTLLADEIIVVDDGSTDGTGEVVGGYGEQVRYIKQKNAGVSVARNVGIEAAKGEWIAFLDADDEWLPEKLERQIGLLKRNPDLFWTAGNFEICFCDEKRRQEKLVTSEGELLLGGKEYFEEYFEACVHGATGWTGTMLIKREVLKEAGLFRAGRVIAEDHDMWWRIAYKWKQIGYNSEPLAIYHMHIPNSAIKRYKDREEGRELLSYHLQLAAEYGRLEAFRPCAAHILRYWIHRYLFDERIVQIRELIVAFDDLLPCSYKSVLRLLTIWPGLTLACMPLLSRINRWIGLKI